jgi:hypothetical protein
MPPPISVCFIAQAAPQGAEHTPASIACQGCTLSSPAEYLVLPGPSRDNIPQALAHAGKSSLKCGSPHVIVQESMGAEYRCANETFDILPSMYHDSILMDFLRPVLLSIWSRDTSSTVKAAHP